MRTRGLTQPIRNGARRLVLAVARPAPSDEGGLLVVAPHPDDETLGCGARIARAVAHGHLVTVVVATKEAGSDPISGESISARRSSELHAAMRDLGVAAGDVIELSFPDGELSRHIGALRDALVETLIQRGPSTVLVTSGDEVHPDHAAASRATRAAVATLHRAPRVREYPVWLWSDWPSSRRHGVRGPIGLARVIGRRTVERTSVEPFRATKQRALSRYDSQLGRDGLPPIVLTRALEDPELAFVVKQ